MEDPEVITEINITDNNILSYMLAHNDDVISARINNCQSLTMIDVEFCNNLTTITIEICPSLKEITITDCSAFTTLPSLPPGLTSLIVTDCPAFTTLPSLPPGLIEFNCDETIIDKLCENPKILFSFIYLTGQPDFTTNISILKQLELADKLEIIKDINNALFEVFIHENSNPLLSRLPDAIKANIMSYLNNKSVNINAEHIEWRQFIVALVKADSKARINAKIVEKRLKDKKRKLGGKRKTNKRSKKRSKRKSKRSRKRQKKRYHSQSRPRNSN